MTHFSALISARPMFTDELLLRALEVECDAVLDAWARENAVSLEEMDVLSVQLRRYVLGALQEQYEGRDPHGADLALHWSQHVRAEAQAFLDQQNLIRGVRGALEPDVPQVKLWVLLPMGCMVMVLLALYVH